MVVGSRGGSAKHPSWAINLRAEPRATVQLGSDARHVRAQEVDGRERDRLWRLVTSEFPLYASYQKRTTRQIPLFVLEPSDRD